MTTSIHLPPDVLNEVDLRAAGRGISRSRYILRALKAALEDESAWSQEFLETLTRASDDHLGRDLIDDMMAAIRSSRASKQPPAL